MIASLKILLFKPLLENMDIFGEGFSKSEKSLGSSFKNSNTWGSNSQILEKYLPLLSCDLTSGSLKHFSVEIPLDN